MDKNKVLTLLAEYHNKWLANVNALINDENIEAEDIVQDTLVKLYTHKDYYRNIAKFSTWIYTIAGNLAKTELRKNKRRKVTNLSDMGSDDWEFEIPAKEDRSKISNEIAEKIVSNNCNSEKLQNYLRIYYIDGYNCAEIAKMQDVSKQAVNEGIRRAILKLREQKAVKNILSEC